MISSYTQHIDILLQWADSASVNAKAHWLFTTFQQLWRFPFAEAMFQADVDKGYMEE